MKRYKLHGRHGKPPAPSVDETVIRAAPMEDGYQRFDYFEVERCYGQ
jgi:hypothetical protein